MAGPKYLMYLTGQHNLIPDAALVSDVTHVTLAFMRSSVFNDAEPSSWPMFTTVDAVRPKFAEGTKIMVAIGGWGDEEGFWKAAATAESRQLFARNVKKMVDETGADGVDIDWEYPGGNGESYKRVPNSSLAWQITAYPMLLSTIRAHLGPDKLISAAVPGLPRDMLAFTPSTLPSISMSVDFLNIMTYDLMNRRDNMTKHHTGLQASLEAIDAYLEMGLQPSKANLGFALYAKWFAVDSKVAEECIRKQLPTNCPTVLMEDPETGVDLGKAGAFSWHDKVPEELAESFARAQNNGEYDEVGGGYYYLDHRQGLWWSWDTPSALVRKFPLVVEAKNLGGAFAWGLGEDANQWRHLKAMNEEFRDSKRRREQKWKDEL
ncbi:MAG: hypothetical protein Q9227_007598 [Pyrenula ochraceoflavens]